MNEYRAGPDTAAADDDIDIDEMMVMVHADRLTTYDERARARARADNVELPTPSLPTDYRFCSSCQKFLIVDVHFTGTKKTCASCLKHHRTYARRKRQRERVFASTKTPRADASTDAHRAHTRPVEDAPHLYATARISGAQRAPDNPSASTHE
jgi:DNA-directed RNA polymerase subunit M/transcription elongation factor TFIIS